MAWYDDLVSLNVILLLTWPVRIFQPVFNMRFSHFLFRLKTFGQPAAVKEEEEMKWLDALSPIGENPLNKVTVYKTWASTS
jgi:hypothetical protein